MDTTPPHCDSLTCQLTSTALRRSSPATVRKRAAIKERTRAAGSAGWMYGCSAAGGGYASPPRLPGLRRGRIAQTLIERDRVAGPGAARHHPAPCPLGPPDLPQALPRHICGVRERARGPSLV